MRRHYCCYRAVQKGCHQESGGGGYPTIVTNGDTEGGGVFKWWRHKLVFLKYSHFLHMKLSSSPSLSHVNTGKKQLKWPVVCDSELSEVVLNNAEIPSSSHTTPFIWDRRDLCWRHHHWRSRSVHGSRYHWWAMLDIENGKISWTNLVNVGHYVVFCCVLLFYVFKTSTFSFNFWYHYFP